MRRTHGRGPVDLLFHGDTGCYTMLMYPPNAPLMHDYSGMGLGGGTGVGTDPFTTNKQVVFMGDSTFFHSGQIAISQAVKLGQDITFIILDNPTTAMTGHQPTRRGLRHPGQPHARAGHRGGRPRHGRGQRPDRRPGRTPSAAASTADCWSRRSWPTG